MSTSKLVFKEVNVSKFKTVRHFQLEGEPSKNLLNSSKIQLSTNREFARSKPDFWLKSHNGQKWSKTLTGLFKTGEDNTFFGDLNYKTHLLVLHIEGQVLEMKIFENYYPFHKYEHPTVIGQKIKFYKKG